MQVFSLRDLVSGFGAVLRLLMGRGFIGSELFAVVGAIVVDVLASRRSRPSGKEPMNKAQPAGAPHW